VEGVDVRDNPEERRYELLVDGSPAGMILYRPRPNALALIHTEVDPSLEGHGLGGQLVAAALDDIRERGLKVVPVCPFVRDFIDEHPEYQDLVLAHGPQR
jgi:hypothetical protein